jgi:hypothetical protein
MDKYRTNYINGKTRQLKLRGEPFWQDFTCLKSPTGSGPRFASVHFGFVQNAKLMFLCKKNPPGTHDEMDDDCHEKYIVEQLLANLPPEPEMIVDNASNRSRKKQKLPTK